MFFAPQNCWLTFRNVEGEGERRSARNLCFRCRNSMTYINDCDECVKRYIHGCRRFLVFSYYFFLVIKKNPPPITSITFREVSPSLLPPLVVQKCFFFPRVISEQVPFGVTKFPRYVSWSQCLPRLSALIMITSG